VTGSGVSSVSFPSVSYQKTDAWRHRGSSQRIASRSPVSSGTASFRSKVWSFRYTCTRYWGPVGALGSPTPGALGTSTPSGALVETVVGDGLGCGWRGTGGASHQDKAPVSRSPAAPATPADRRGPRLQ